MKNSINKECPEEFSKESLYLINFTKFMKSNENEHLRLLNELAEIKTTIQEFEGNILLRLDELREPYSTVENSSSKEIGKNVPDLIEEALSKSDSLSFSQLLEATQVTAPTLSKHLSKMVEEGIVERIETDRTVLYRLRRRENG